MKLRIAIVSPHAHFGLRLNRVQTLIIEGIEVWAITPTGSHASSLRKVGTKFAPWKLKRRSLNPIRAIMAVYRLACIYKKVKPNIAHCFTVKPNIYGAIAARLSGVPVVIATVTGLGYVFSDNGWRSQALRLLVLTLYKLAFSLTDQVLFSNRDDLELFAGMKIISRDKACVLPGVESVDTSFFDTSRLDCRDMEKLRRSLNIPEEGLIVTMISRMLWHKGVAEYEECARIIKQRFTNVQFLLIGPIDDGSPASIPLRQLDAWNGAGWVHYIGKRKDIRELLGLTDIFVLPSFYREGLPTVLLEAAAMGKPIITTNVPGCRDAVEHGLNGFLVPPRDTGALTKAVEQLLVNDDLRRRFGKESRKRAILEFDEQKMVKRLLNLYNLYRQI